MDNFVPIWPKGQAVLPTSFNVTLPEIYQIEATCACNYECPMCYRFFGERQYENSYFPLDLAQKMIDRGDFGGSYFVEFQLSGEPLLHPHLKELIQIVKKTGVKTGLSTNGSLLHPKAGKMAERNLAAVCELDALTVSVDGVDELTYELYRPVKDSHKHGTQGPSFTFTAGELFEVVDLVLSQPKHPILDLQIIELPGWEAQMKKLIDLCKMRGWVRNDVNLRTTPDCSIISRGELDASVLADREHELCLNPWTSVTVLSSGKVVSCCFDFHGLNEYGDLKHGSLAEIWAGKEVKVLRQAHMSGQNLPFLCRTCYMRSPYLIHVKFFRNWSQGGGIYFAPGRETRKEV